MNRETNELVTTSGKKIVVKSYLTGRESNDLKKIMFKGLSIDNNVADGEKAKVGKLPLTVAIERQEKLLEIVAVSIDGDISNVFEKLLDLPSDEYDDLMKQIEEKLKLNLTKTK